MSVLTQEKLEEIVGTMARVVVELERRTEDQGNMIDWLTDYCAAVENALLESLPECISQLQKLGTVPGCRHCLAIAELEGLRDAPGAEEVRQRLTKLGQHGP